MLDDLKQYDHPFVTVDVVLFTIMENDLKILLVQRDTKPYRAYWALPGGFVNVGESLDAAAMRTLKEKTNVQDVYLEQLYTLGEPKRDPRAHVITISYYALVSSELFKLIPSEAIKDVKWHSVYTPPQLAFDHQKIFQFALDRLRNKLGYTTVGFQLLPEKFTLPELCRMYEVILNKKIDKRNFRKKINELDILIDTQEYTQAFSKKPAKLYRFKKQENPELLLNSNATIDPKIPQTLSKN